MAEFTQTIDIDQLAISLPRRLHLAAERHIAEAPDRIALIEDGRSWTYRELGRNVGDIANRLAALGIRAGDRVIVVSENCIALAGLLLAASRIDAWAIVANPRLSAREIDQIRQHGISPTSTAITSTSSRPANGRRKSSFLMRCLRPRPERLSSISSPNR